MTSIIEQSAQITQKILQIIWMKPSGVFLTRKFAKMKNFQRAQRCAPCATWKTAVALLFLLLFKYSPFYYVKKLHHSTPPHFFVNSNNTKFMRNSWKRCSYLLDCNKICIEDFNKVLLNYIKTLNNADKNMLSNILLIYTCVKINYNRLENTDEKNELDSIKQISLFITELDKHSDYVNILDTYISAGRVPKYII